MSQNFLSAAVFGKTALEFTPNREIFRQRDPANAVYYLREGLVKLSARSQTGREVIVSLVHDGEFFGTGCLVECNIRRETATAMTVCKVERVEKPAMARLLAEQPYIREVFLRGLFARNVQYEEDLVDHVASASEKRLARILLRLANVSGGDVETPPVLMGVHQEDLAQMIGTTRPRVSHFMSEFKKRGYVDYDRAARLTIRKDQLSLALASWKHQRSEHLLSAVPTSSELE